MLTRWVTPWNDTQGFSYSEALSLIRFDGCFVFPPQMTSLPFQTCGRPGNERARTACELWRPKKDQSCFGAELDATFLPTGRFQTAVQASVSGGRSRSVDSRPLTSNVCHRFLFHDPADHQPISLLGPRLTPKTKPGRSHDSNYYIRSPLFRLRRMFLCLFEKLWASGLQRWGGNISWVTK